MTFRDPDQQVKLCCATFYQSDIARLLLGDVFHPGGLALTRHLGTLLGLAESDSVLDVACGRGASAVHLAERFGCHVTGVDYGPDNIAAAIEHAVERGVETRTSFQEGDAEGIGFGDGTFDAVISECSFCTFPDKAAAAAEMARVLGPDGRLGIADVTVDGQLPDDIQTLLAWVVCIAGAGTPDDYVTTLREAGFAGFVVEDQSAALLEMVNDVRCKLLGLELASGLGRLDLGDIDLGEGKRLARRAVDLIDEGVVGYTLITARATGAGGVGGGPSQCPGPVTPWL
jgi:SAM-dependent methyltransferase